MKCKHSVRQACIPRPRLEWTHSVLELMPVHLQQHALRQRLHAVRLEPTCLAQPDFMAARHANEPATRVHTKAVLRQSPIGAIREAFDPVCCDPGGFGGTA